MENFYQKLCGELRQSGFEAVLKSEDQLIISKQRGPAWPFSGNSFWISCKADKNYICTWSPTCYEIPTGADVAQLCIEFMAVGEAAQAIIPRTFVERYNLNELSDSAAAKVFGWEQ